MQFDALFLISRTCSPREFAAGEPETQPSELCATLFRGNQYLSDYIISLAARARYWLLLAPHFAFLLSLYIRAPPG